MELVSGVSLVVGVVALALYFFDPGHGVAPVLAIFGVGLSLVGLVKTTTRREKILGVSALGVCVAALALTVLK